MTSEAIDFPARVDGETDEQYAAFKLRVSGMTYEEVSASAGIPASKLRVWATRKRWNERIERAAAGPAPEPGDRVSRAIENGMGALLGWLETLSPDEVKAVDAARIAEACTQLRNGSVGVTPPPWTDAAHRDLLRGLLSDLPPSDPACPFDVRRLTWEQREVFTWLFERAMGDPKPFRAPGELVPGSPAQAEPAFHAVTSDTGGGNVSLG